MTPILPIRIPLSLQPDEEAEFSLMLHADRPGEQELCLLFVYREVRSHNSYVSTTIIDLGSARLTLNLSIPQE